MVETKIQADLVSAMKEHNDTTVRALRFIKAAIQNEKTSGTYHELTDSDVLKLIQKLAKQRQESIEIYTQANRTDLADIEKNELTVLQSYLPQPLTETEIKNEITNIIAELGASSIKNLGKVMQSFNSKFSGRADGKIVSTFAKEILN